MRDSSRAVKKEELFEKLSEAVNRINELTETLAKLGKETEITLGVDPNGVVSVKLFEKEEFNETFKHFKRLMKNISPQTQEKGGVEVV